MHALLFLVGQCDALATSPIMAKPMTYRSPALKMDAAQEKEIKDLKARLKATEAKITELTSKAGLPWNAHVIGEQVIEDSRFPLFRKVQSSVSKSYLDYVDSKKKDVKEPSVEQLFSKYDADRSGQLDIGEFRNMVNEMSLLGVKLDFGAMAGDAAKSAETLVSDTAKSADDFAKSISGSVNNLAKAVTGSKVPVTLVGGLGSGYKEILAGAGLGSKDIPVEPLVLAIERQATLTMQLGGFMQLIVKLDQGNMKTVRESWEAHGRPSSLRALLEAEVAEGVIEPTRLKEGSAALSLLWSMRAKRFWTTVADGFADQESSETSTDFGIRAYENELEPYHAFIFKNTFRTGLRALPSRKEMLGKMALMPSASMGLDTCWEGWEASAEAGEDLTPDERMAACLVELRECSDVTKRVTNIVQAVLDDLELRDDRKL
jgi:hypothetical protein